MPSFWLFSSPAFWNNVTQGSDQGKHGWAASLWCRYLCSLCILPLRSIANCRLRCLLQEYPAIELLLLLEAIALHWWIHLALNQHDSLWYTTSDMNNHLQQTPVVTFSYARSKCRQTSGNKVTRFAVHFLSAVRRASLKKFNKPESVSETASITIVPIKQQLMTKKTFLNTSTFDP